MTSTHSSTQLIDDTLDFSSSTAQLGKPGFADLRLGLATGPALYAAEEYPELEGMIVRRFSGEGDVERVSFASSNPYFDHH
jgi:hexaprenyl-diphosphate synthase